MNVIDSARTKTLTPLIKKIIRQEHQDTPTLLNNIATGKTVILKHRIHRLKTPCAVGKGLRTKVNVNIGTSTDVANIKFELKKLTVSIENGADTIMDLSVGANIEKTRREILNHSSIPVGTVPIYEAIHHAERKRKSYLKMTKEDLLEIIEKQAREGVDFFTIHAGVTKEIIQKIPSMKKRIIEIVSRGGALLANWIHYNKKENPLYEYFDDILKIAKKFDKIGRASCRERV